MKASIQLRLAQHLALTPQLQQSIRLLQLSTLELNQELEQAMADNPLLERDDDPLAGHARLASDGAIRDAGPNADAPGGADGVDAESGPPPADAGSGPEPESDFPAPSLDWGSPRESRDDDDEPEALAWAAAGTTLNDHLRQQLSSTQASPRDRVLVNLLIEAVEEDGYIRTSLEEIQAMCPLTAAVELDELSAALRLLQSFDPVGVGARSLEECLLLQIEARLRSIAPGTGDAHSQCLELAKRVVSEHLLLFANRDFVKLKKLTGANDDRLRAVHHLIHGLNPRPGLGFGTTAPDYVVPDILVRRQSSRWTAQLNPDVMPRLRVNQAYATIFKRDKGQPSHAMWSARLQEARWLIRNLRQRFQTIQRVSQAIVDRQSHFFSHGAIAMRPLVLREIADAVGLHESTVSRVTANKYMATPFGVFELRYFFGSHVATDAGGAASSTAIRALIGQLIAAEDRGKPLSDSRIAELLGDQGIVVARRTVAKYRELLHIPPVALRKTL
ncbi:MAG TPA: RNA polymerase factor sigma-54 [Burkholderiaceae bacterium]|jgi:RNA polymerase sigma-54 factor|nr:RNA polymerase factor sigma-54 [Burkholderiaceae bacterium]